ncbi:MAG: GntR family transcriptional regulator [Tissierellia bacterium]|nr:GntR family transcriptional regulator [Tissierellia bacterium]
MNLRNKARKLILKEIEYSIENGIEKLPSERAFVEKYNLSRVTLRSALSDLEREGKIIRRQGKGTFISPNYSDMKIDLFRMKTYGQIIKEKGYKLCVKTLDTNIVKTPDFVKNTSLYENNNMVITTRVYFANDKVAAVCIDYLKDSYKSEIPNISNYKGSIFGYLLDNHNIRLSTGSIQFFAVEANDIKKSIDIDDSLLPEKCILIEGIEYDTYNEKPLMFTKEYVNTDIIPITTIRKR